jgi:hypothetical protein
LARHGTAGASESVGCRHFQANERNVFASAGPGLPIVKRADALQQQIERESTLVAHR